MAEGDYRIEFLDLEAFDPVETNSDHRGDRRHGSSTATGSAFMPVRRSFPGPWRGRVSSARCASTRARGHLPETVSAPSSAGEHGRIAVKAVDDRGNELMVVKLLSKAETGA